VVVAANSFALNSLLPLLEEVLYPAGQQPETELLPMNHIRPTAAAVMATTITAVRATFLR
jgi:hypothetical protein